MLIIRGVNVFPSQVEHVLMQTPGAEPHYLLVLRREKALDTLEAQVEAQADLHAAGPEAMVALAAQIRRKLHELLGLTVEVTVLRLPSRATAGERICSCLARCSPRLTASSTSFMEKPRWVCSCGAKRTSM